VRALTLRYNQRLFRLARAFFGTMARRKTWCRTRTSGPSRASIKFRGDASFGTWLTRIAMNEALGRLRRRRATVDWPAGGDEPIRAQILHFPAASSGADPEAAMATLQLRELIERAIDDLPDTFRAVFIARMVKA
jgi:RNA polymerase sigma-70 factor (ECF subfamily)